MKATEAKQISEQGVMSRKEKRQLKLVLRRVEGSAKEGWTNAWFYELRPRVIEELKKMGYDWDREKEWDSINWTNLKL